MKKKNVQFSVNKNINRAKTRHHGFFFDICLLFTMVSIAAYKRKRKGRQPDFFFSYITAVLFFFVKPKKACTTGTCSPRSSYINQSSVIIDEKKQHIISCKTDEKKNVFKGFLTLSFYVLFYLL